MSGGPVLDKTRGLGGVHIGTIYHLDSTHAPNKVRTNCDVLVRNDFIIVVCVTMKQGGAWC